MIGKSGSCFFRKDHEERSMGSIAIIEDNCATQNYSEALLREC
jgi:hypothetical protein